jgi:hypothetical protein
MARVCRQPDPYWPEGRVTKPWPPLHGAVSERAPGL